MGRIRDVKDKRRTVGSNVGVFWCADGLSSGNRYNVIAGWHKGSLEVTLGSMALFFLTHFQLLVCR